MHHKASCWEILFNSVTTGHGGKWCTIFIVNFLLLVSTYIYAMSGQHLYELWSTSQCLSMLLISEVWYWPKLFINFVMQTLQYCSNYMIYFFTLKATTIIIFIIDIVLPLPIDWFICIAKIHDIKPNYLTLIALHFQASVWYHSN